ncbi:MAG: alpha-glucan family phosphorylase [Clostridiales bacterium]|jgi:glucan phosphorylase|nr:alpha-glucan family phosphorylase [Clostridiales bacterium]
MGTDASLKKPTVAYFCMEYGLDNGFKIFSGGLGILAGDLIKAARDADYPMVAVGILWRQGYTSQTIGPGGSPVDAYPEYRYDFLKDTGAEVSVAIKGSKVRCKVWLCDCFGNIPLYLLDAFLPGNPEALVTGQLYGWFAEERLAQEIILGVGGVRALDALGIRPDIYHFNEGHAALAGLELIRREMEGASMFGAPAGAGAADGGNGACGGAGNGAGAAVGAVDGAGAGAAGARAGTASGTIAGTGAGAGAAAMAGAGTAAGAGAISGAVAAAGATGAEVAGGLGAGTAAGAATGTAASLAACAGAAPSVGAPAPQRRSARFKKAWDSVRKHIVFTTHTPVMAGNESHEHRAMLYMGANNGFTPSELARLGGAPFNMTVAGLNLSYLANAVSELHADTANKMWAHVRTPSKILSVTNGVHNGTWQDAGIAGAAASEGGGALWDLHMRAKARLIGEIEARNNVRFDPERLLIGFARRAAPYKRSDLIFRDVGKIAPLLESGKVQLAFSGKAHPNDMAGKAIVSNLSAVARQYPGSVAFLQNYDMEIGMLMTRGCDVWLNNPIRPLEASGTSGMKAAMNGVLNFSVLDGWWPEGCAHGENGWQIGGGYEGDDCDAVDAESLYAVLTGEIIPTYYGDRAKWLDMMRSSVRMSERKFSAARMLDDYADRLYSRWPGA